MVQIFKMKYLAAFVLCFSIISCELSPPPPDCNETAPFSKLEIDSKSYQDAVISKLENRSSLDYRYFFKTFFDQNDETFMTLNFRSNAECFDVNVLVQKWDKLAGMKKVNGKSYPKELINLKWTIQEFDGMKMIVYQDMDWIID